MKYVSKNQLQRYPVYHKLLLNHLKNGEEFISSRVIAAELGYSEEQVRKDLQAITTYPGTPKRGRNLNELVLSLEEFLGYNDMSQAILIGVGHLGAALLNYKLFPQMGLKIIEAFDNDPKKVGLTINNIEVKDYSSIKEFIKSSGVKIAILCIPGENLQVIVDEIVKMGIVGIWNFAPGVINVSDRITVQNVDLASSFAVLTHNMKQKIKAK